MIIKENIKAKRQYTPPAIHVRVLQMEGLLGTLTGQATGDDYKPGAGDGGGGNLESKKVSFLEDDQTEE